jgi:predicted MFS family arabinose efflux permease
MLYRLTNPYKGLSREIWYLSAITLVNRAGAMVIPFLSLYLNKHLHFTLEDIGWVMTAFGFGSALGSFTGGKLTDRFGYLKVMVSSLVLTGVMFFVLQFLEYYWLLMFGVFLLSFVADTYRPAIWVAMDAYSNTENKTRSVTLIRLAINLGFAVGPALGGFIIAHIGYTQLFWIDGGTSILAAFLLWKFIAQKQSKKVKEEVVSENRGPFITLPRQTLLGFLFCHCIDGNRFYAVYLDHAGIF